MKEYRVDFDQNQLNCFFSFWFIDLFRK